MKQPIADDDLRQRALERMGQQDPLVVVPTDEAAVRRLLHEVQVHQVELELQNEELQRARAETEDSLVQFTALYDHAPIGYVTLSANGVVRRANAAAGRLLQCEPGRLIGRPMAEWIEQLDRPAWRGFLQRLLGDAECATCELSMTALDGGLRVTRVEGRAADSEEALRITLTDVTSERLAATALRRSEARLRRAYRQLAHAQEGERLRVAGQLHDQVGRNLTALGLNLAMLDDAFRGELGSPVRTRLDDSIGLLQSTVADVRSLMSELYPPMLIDYGLFAALRWWAGELARKHAIEIRMLDSDLGLRQSAEIESALFRIAQEALANAIKHARAERIDISLRHHGRGLRLEIVDDGRGFDPGAPAADDETVRWGLMMMRERALAIGAELKIDSVLGRGTRIRIDGEDSRR